MTRATIHRRKTDRYHEPVDAEATRIASVAAERFHACGITASGVAELSRAAGVSKRTLYERFGFRSAGIRPRYYQDNGEDAVIMWRTPEGTPFL